MWGSRSVKKEQRLRSWGVNVKPENLITGIILGFILGYISDLFMNSKGSIGRGSAPSSQSGNSSASPSDDDELKMVLVVRQDLKMGTGKIASQCAHAAVGMYDELLQSQRSLLMQWWQCGQPKIVVKCKNQREMDRLKDEAEDVGLPTFIVADAGRTQISAGSRTVLAIGPGSKSTVDSITRKLHLL
ncbi:uncharacterized protein LOC116255374 [Nymphaea colorata]|nr:uncharacterized protein LOC116255374 [Nymphaea colorata]XP_031487021.1 uncharacterized protein LOC116255374 [Nymphaea colorata]XP_031487022.1 uncharacterized protein LOC116255374 [Nymphaea colorata]